MEREEEKKQLTAMKQQVLFYVVEMLAQRGLVSREEEMAVKSMVYRREAKKMEGEDDGACGDL